MPKVSVVIPAYNAMSYLPLTIDSLLNQTFKDFEVIIVNDGSLDSIENWIAQIGDPRIHLICQKNQGAAVARNTGIKHAKGEYIAFLDADDLWESTKLEKQVDLLNKNKKVGVVYCWAALINDKGEPTGRIFKSDCHGYIWEKLTEKNVVMCGSTAMVRRQCFQFCGEFDPDIKVAEDWDMWLRIATNYPFALVSEPLVHYRQHPNNKSKNYGKELESFRLIIEKAFKSAPFELLYLRNRSYALINFLLAWKCIQCLDKDFKAAEYFRSQAFKHYPKICFSQECLRLSIAIIIVRWFGSNSYEKFINLVYTLRRRTLNIESK